MGKAAKKKAYKWAKSRKQRTDAAILNHESVCLAKEQWLKSPQRLWPELSDSSQDEMWSLQLELCCQVEQFRQIKGEGFFCIHPDSLGYSYHWVSANEAPQQWAAMEEAIDKANESSFSHFWVCINAGGIISPQCYQMRFPCELAAAT
jgi:hypothetical protein